MAARKRQKVSQSARLLWWITDRANTEGTCEFPPRMRQAAMKACGFTAVPNFNRALRQLRDHGHILYGKTLHDGQWSKATVISKEFTQRRLEEIRSMAEQLSQMQSLERATKTAEEIYRKAGGAIEAL